MVKIISTRIIISGFSSVVIHACTMSAVSFKTTLKSMPVSRESYLTPDSVMTRPRAQSQWTPGRRQRKISHGRKVSQSSSPRKRRESRRECSHAMQSAANNLSHDQHLHVVKEVEASREPQRYFDKVGTHTILV